MMNSFYENFLNRNAIWDGDDEEESSNPSTLTPASGLYESSYQMDDPLSTRPQSLSFQTRGTGKSDESTTYYSTTYDRMPGYGTSPKTGMPSTIVGTHSSPALSTYNNDINLANYFDVEEDMETSCPHLAGTVMSGEETDMSAVLADYGHRLHGLGVDETDGEETDMSAVLADYGHRLQGLGVNETDDDASVSTMSIATHMTDLVLLAEGGATGVLALRGPQPDQAPDQPPLNMAGIPNLSNAQHQARAIERRKQQFESQRFLQSPQPQVETSEIASRHVHGAIPSGNETMQTTSRATLWTKMPSSSSFSSLVSKLGWSSPHGPNSENPEKAEIASPELPRSLDAGDRSSSSAINSPQQNQDKAYTTNQDERFALDLTQYEEDEVVITSRTPRNSLYAALILLLLLGLMAILLVVSRANDSAAAETFYDPSTGSGNGNSSEQETVFHPNDPLRDHDGKGDKDGKRDKNGDDDDTKDENDDNEGETVEYVFDSKGSQDSTSSPTPQTVKDVNTATPTAYPTAFPSAFPSASPTSLEDHVFEILTKASPDIMVRIGESISSPQARAMEWLLDTAWEKPSYIRGVTDQVVLQRFALATFYYSTGGDTTWKEHDWLDANVPECDWFNNAPISCNDKGILTNLELANNGMTGTLPPELGLLSSLENLSLADNEIGGSIPSDLTALRLLKVLDLKSNQLNGSLPNDMGNLAALQYLSLMHNAELSGPLPLSMGSMLLDEIYLTGTSLTGNADELFCGIRNGSDGDHRPSNFWADCEEIVCNECCTKCCAEALMFDGSWCFGF